MNAVVLVRYRLSLLQRALPTLGGWFGFAVISFIVWVKQHPHIPVHDVIALVQLPFWTTIGTLVLFRGYGVSVLDDGMIVHGVWNRTLRWRDVRAIQIERTLGSRFVVVHDVSGKRIRLRAPLSNFDRRFDDKYRMMVKVWQTRTAAMINSGL